VTKKGASAGVVDAANALPGGKNGHNRQEGCNKERTRE